MEVFPDGSVSASIKKGPNLYEFLVEAELQHYFNSFKTTLKITHPSQLKFTTDSDLLDIRMSKPEIRRLKKYYEKHFPNNYLSKLKKILSHRRHQSNVTEANLLINNDTTNLTAPKTPKVSSKHIIPATSITINKELGMGEFGIVQQGVWCNEGERIQVAIKCLSRDRMQSNMVEFLKEASIMHNIDHPNIVRFFGVVLPNVDGSLMLVTELAPLRSLLECLKEPSLRSSFPVLTLCDFAYQICDGMQYLEENRLIHRDLAARNILAFSKNKVKISDFGLSRALGQGKDYYQTNFNVNLKLPIAWCAPECISYLRFTTASDVWAFGVTLWEMFSYGFQPWAALTGQQILEAIDEPNFQRLEQPDCCPLEHYNLMANCWRHDPAARPKFSEISSILVESRPEQVKAKITSNEGPHMLSFRVGDIITVLDKKTHTPFWKGTTINGKTGLFDPVNVVTFLSSDLPSSNFLRAGIDSTRSSARRKLKSEMISAPQGDFKHAGHIGYDGAFFGDLSFLGGSKGNYGSVPTQVVAPYRPHNHDSEEAPLLESFCLSPPPTPATTTTTTTLQDHEYHEISDEETNHSPGLDLGPSLMAEMEMMFSNLGTQSNQEHEGSSNRCNELKEKLNSKSKRQATVKPISSQDKKTIDTVIAMSNEFTIRSLSGTTPTTPTVGTNKKKNSFSFKFPTTTAHDPTILEKQMTIDNCRNFSEQALSTTDLQSKITQEEQMAYEGLVDSPTPEVCQLIVTNPLKMLRNGPSIIYNRNRSIDGMSSSSNTLPSKLYGHEKKNDTLGTFSLNRHTITHPKIATEETSKVENNNNNTPVPSLPPRDKSKLLLTAKPRHTRKHPLIIPGSSIQRTLDKVNTVSPLNTSLTNSIEPVYSNDVVVVGHRNLESLHFEQQIESNLNALDDIHSEIIHEVVNIGTCFSKNDKEEEEEKIQSHHVSCEDLTKFANWKPNSRTRGHDSDEVRIMSKVLGKDIPLEKCLEALDQFDWDVMKAIKVLKVYKAVNTDLKSCQNALENTMWDVNNAAQWILHMDGEVAQV